MCAHFFCWAGAVGFKHNVKTKKRKENMESFFILVSNQKRHGHAEISRSNILAVTFNRVLVYKPTVGQ